ncbi:uncharacterized protein G2W53_012817 [Senna tora]|uniref:Uncharacterized protein n=1 Tax=Senna tora TaxID=362788 RepID=A0A834TYP6_9FABA|nr:uncharacterized protein G2W53_012817 [Senna tora]
MGIIYASSLFYVTTNWMIEENYERPNPGL